MNNETPASPGTALIQTNTLAGWDFTGLRVIETAQTRDAFDAGHIPGSVFWPLSELFTPGFRLQTDPAHFAAFLSRSGITPETLIVCSDNGSPAMSGWAAWLFWILTGFGHVNAVVLDDGTPRRQREDRPLARREPAPAPAVYPLPPAFSLSERATLAQVREASAQSLQSPNAPSLIDVRPVAD